MKKTNSDPSVREMTHTARIARRFVVMVIVLAVLLCWGLVLNVNSGSVKIPAAEVFSMVFWSSSCCAAARSARQRCRSPDAEVYRTILKIVLGLLSALTLLIAGYYGNLSLPRTRSDHRKMERFYTEMGENLARFGQSDALLTHIAREELIENGNWCSYQRDNTPDICIG